MDEVDRNVERFARLANREVAAVLADTIIHPLPVISAVADILLPVSELSNSEVLALTQLEMELNQDSRLSELLEHQQAGLLSDVERLELNTLMQTYQEQLLRKATALDEAVHRGLMEPLNS